MGVGLVVYFRMEYVCILQPLRGCDMLRLACCWVVVSSFFAVACYSFAEVLFNNYSSSPNGLRVNSPFGLRSHGLLTQRAMRAR